MDFITSEGSFARRRAACMPAVGNCHSGQLRSRSEGWSTVSTKSMTLLMELITPEESLHAGVLLAHQSLKTVIHGS